MRSLPSFAVRDGGEMEKAIERPKKSSKLQSGWRVFLNGESEANSDVFSRSQILSLSFTARKMNSDSMPINSKHRVVSSISASHRRSASSPVFPSPDSPLLTCSPQISPDLTLSPKCDGHVTVPTSSWEIVEDPPSQWQRRSRYLSRSTSLQELFEAEARDRDQPSIEYGDHYFSRNLTGFSHSAWHSNSAAPSHKTTLGELLITDAKDHPRRIRSCHKRVYFSGWKARIEVLQSQWKRIISIISRKHSTPRSRTQLNLPSSQTTMSGSDSQQVIANRWLMKSARSQAPNQSSANWLSCMESSSSPASRFSRQLSLPSSAHELYYLSRRTQSDRSRKRTFLPYREQLISFFSCIRP